MLARLRIILGCRVDVDAILNEISSSDSDDAEQSAEETKVPDKREEAKAKETEAAKAGKEEGDPLAEMQLSDPDEAVGKSSDSDENGEGLEEARTRRSRLLDKARATKSFAPVAKSKDDDDLMEKGRPSEGKAEAIEYPLVPTVKSEVTEKVRAPSADKAEPEQLGQDLVNKAEGEAAARRERPRSDRLGQTANLFKSFTVGLTGHNRAKNDLLEADKEEDDGSAEENARILR